MCGIKGLFAYHPAAPPPTELELLNTRDRMRPRGPDGCGTWWDASRRCGLGHRRLSIIDLSDRAAQPMNGEAGNLVVVFNGEIYNSPWPPPNEPKGIVSRSWSRIVLPSMMSANENNKYEALAS